MTVQLVVLGIRRPNTDDRLGAYGSVAGPLLMKAGGTPVGKWSRIGSIAGDDHPVEVTVFEFADEETVRAVFDSPEYQAVVEDRDAAYERLDIFLASA